MFLSFKNALGSFKKISSVTPPAPGPSLFLRPRVGGTYFQLSTNNRYIRP